MPNWCSNQIKLGGTTEEIERIWNTLEDDKQDDGLLSAIAPLDGEWEYEDAVTSWGTKWDIKHDHGLIFIFFVGSVDKFLHEISFLSLVECSVH